MTSENQGSGGPPAHAGAALRALLQGRSVSAVSHLARAPQGSADLLAQAFTVSVRRRFVAEPDLRAVAGYVAEALPRQNLPAGGRLAREAEALIRTMLGEEGLGDGITDAHVADIQLAIVADLARSQRLSPEDVEALAVEAESRVARFGPPRNHSQPRDGLLSRLRANRRGNG
jgi:hypothetical protein